MIEAFIFIFWNIFAMIVLVTITHEYGHYWYLKNVVKDKEASIVFDGSLGVPFNESVLVPKQRVLLYLSGIVAGAIPIFIASLYEKSFFWIFIFYALMIVTDTTRIFKEVFKK